MIIFEHVLQLEGLNRESVWRELEWLLRNPKLVLAGCDESSVQDTETSDGGRWLKRTKRFGDLVIEDQVDRQIHRIRHVKRRFGGRADDDIDRLPVLRLRVRRQ